MQPAFSAGQIVCLKADPNRQGPVIEVLPPVAGRIRYRVFHSPGEIREYSEEQLSSVQSSPITPMDKSVLSFDSFLGSDEFLARLTACRLANPLTDNLYALHAARIKFIPFQFKPLLRLLRSDRPRLLIADEVGVGKTIEAGLILKDPTWHPAARLHRQASMRHLQQRLDERPGGVVRETTWLLN